MEPQHFYFVKSILEKYEEHFEIKVIFQSHLRKSKFRALRKHGLISAIRKRLCNHNKYGKLLKSEKIKIYNIFYDDIGLDFFISKIGEKNTIVCSDINSDEVVRFVHDFQPDLFLLQGGRLLRQNFLTALDRAYILHLHLGIVPYYRGGNSQFWTIYNNAVNENGFTIQSVDLNIDTGAIYIRKSIVDFDENDNHHSMYCKTQLAGIESLKKLIEFYMINNYIPKPIEVTEKGFNYTGKMVTESACKYVFLNGKEVLSSYCRSPKKPAYKNISVI
ncbi:hypothetical protein BZJ19_16955 [Salinivibrio proteolyticus]|nr:hypothetical protein BZJ19_16955 [Salinivibrio proteolyticus]